MNNTTPQEEAQHFLEKLVKASPALVVTGAGISVSTGIPTYRDENGKWLRSDPITHQQFLGDTRQQQRYWGRSLLGWPAVRDARPASGHRLLAQLEHQGFLSHIVTQNVDRLHQRAGSIKVTDLHGRLDRVVCLGCKEFLSRELLQAELARLNPGINHYTVSARPDGDADLPDETVDSITVPKCKACGGVLMPDVVFFGGSIPSERVKACERELSNANSLLVVGSSLQVYSGYRFCKWAAAAGKPIFLMNPGTTRADPMAIKWQVEADTGLAALRTMTQQTRRQTPTGHTAA